MSKRIKILIGMMLVAGYFSIAWSVRFPADHWVRFTVYLVVVLLSSGMKVAMPKGDGTMSVNFPLILLGIAQLSPFQAIALAALSVAVQCRIKVVRPFTFVQIAFNVANVISATAAAALTFLYATQAHLELAPALSIAAVAYFFANTIPVALIIAWSKREDPFRLWYQEFPWYLPFYLVGAILAAIAHLISLRFGWITSLLLTPVIYTIYRAYRSQMAMLRDRQKHLEETEALHFRTIEGLAMAIEAKDQNTHDHLLRVRVYVSEIGKAVGLDDLQMQALLTAAFLHDIGKLAVPEHILNKPGKLTPEEFEKMKIHPVVGADILNRVRFPYPVVPIVRAHHEAWDGSGYPDGLKGEEIPIGARILTVVDCFDALASDRPYRKAMPLEEAMALVKRNAGSQFDPKIVEVLEQKYIQLEELARKQGEEMVPLNTEVSVWRGAAPAAGFQEDNAPCLAEPGANCPPRGESQTEDPHFHLQSLDLIAAASQEAQAIFEISQMLGNSLSLNETASVMSSRLRVLIPFDCLILYLKDGNALGIQYSDGDAARAFHGTRIVIGEGLSGWVAQSGKPILNGNPTVEPNYDSSRDLSQSLGSALSLPLYDVSNEIFGVLTLYSAALNAFSRENLRVLQTMEVKFSLAVQNALRFGNPDKESAVDFITQLPNMRQFFVRLEAELNRSERSGQQFTLLVCDLNSFKAVNDERGHLTGNLLLKSIADGLRECSRSYDTVARMGGAEFVLLLPGVNEQTCSRQLESIAATVKKACTNMKIDVPISTSIGTAFFPKDGNSAETLLNAADRRMYLHKRRQFEGERGQHANEPVQVAALA